MVSCPTGTKVEPCSRYDLEKNGGGGKGRGQLRHFVVLHFDGVGRVGRRTTSTKAKICPNEEMHSKLNVGKPICCNQLTAEPIVDELPNSSCENICWVGSEFAV